jgi:hypothetical protein
VDIATKVVWYNQVFVPPVPQRHPVIKLFALFATLSIQVAAINVVSDCTRGELQHLHAKYLKYFVSMYGFTLPMMWEKSEWIEFIKTHMIGTREIQNYKRNLRSILNRGRIERTGMDAVLEMMTSVFGNDAKLKKIVSGMESIMRLGFPPQASTNLPRTNSNASPTNSRPATNAHSIPRTTSQPVPNRNGSSPSAQSPPTSTAQDFISLDTLIQNGAPASSLSIRQLKNILLLERVSMSATLEKQELVDKVDMLLRNRRIEMEIVNRSDGISPAASSAGTSPARSQPENATPDGQHPASMFNIDDLLCKVCLALPTNCVFLECGHLVCCMDCGTLIFKTQKLCCVCRAPITRIVHTFRV